MDGLITITCYKNGDIIDGPNGVIVVQREVFWSTI